MARKNVNAEELMRVLKYGGLEKENLRELVQVVVGLGKLGIVPERVFPLGIPVPDGLQVSAVCNAAALKELIAQVISNARIQTVKVFPYGIPNPEVFVAEFGIR